MLKFLSTDFLRRFWNILSFGFFRLIFNIDVSDKNEACSNSFAILFWILTG